MQYTGQETSPAARTRRPDLPEIPPTWALRWALSHLAGGCQILVTHGFVGLRAREGEGDAAHAPAAGRQLHRGVCPPAECLHRPGQRRWVHALSGRAWALPAVRLAGLPVVAARRDR